MKKKKVLVTGGCGFIGREVIKQLLEKRYSVVVVDDFSNSTLLEETPNLQIIDFDLTKSQGLSEILKGIDYCIHLAARVGGIKYMSSNQSEILKDDILIDTNIISAVSEARAKIIYASTVIVYDQLKELPFREEQVIVSPKSNYGFSKFVGERLCQVFGKDKGLKFAIARISNTYGINRNNIKEEKLHVIPDLIRKILREKTLRLINEGRQGRTFVHVDDVAEALVLMMESDYAIRETFNISSGDRYQILDLAKMIWGLLKRGEQFHFENIGLEDDYLTKSFADASKINRLLKWQAKKTLKNSLPGIVEWYAREYGTKKF